MTDSLLGKKSKDQKLPKMAPERGGGGVALNRLHVHSQETLSYIRGLHLGFSLGNYEETSKAPSREGASN